jgi:hypothetical protein
MDKRCKTKELAKEKSKVKNGLNDGPGLREDCPASI